MFRLSIREKKKKKVLTLPKILQAELAFSYNFGNPIADHLTLVNARKKKILTKVVGKLVRFLIELVLF